MVQQLVPGMVQPNMYTPPALVVLPVIAVENPAMPGILAPAAQNVVRGEALEVELRPGADQGGGEAGAPEAQI
jgi:hypothetical protein